MICCASFVGWDEYVFLVSQSCQTTGSLVGITARPGFLTKSHCRQRLKASAITLVSFPIGSMGLVYLPKKNQPNVGKYRTIHSSYGS